MKVLICTSVLWLALAGVASATDRFPCVPALDELVKARLDLLDARQQRERDKENIALLNNGWRNKFLYDRVSGTGSYGKGLTVDSKMDGVTGHTLIQTNNTNATWTITYTLPLNTLFDMRMTRAKADAEIDLLREKQKLERQDEVTKISLQYGDFLEAKTKLLSSSMLAS